MKTIKPQFESKLLYKYCCSLAGRSLFQNYYYKVCIWRLENRFLTFSSLSQVVNILYGLTKESESLIIQQDRQTFLFPAALIKQEAICMPPGPLDFRAMFQNRTTVSALPVSFLLGHLAAAQAFSLFFLMLVG